MKAAVYEHYGPPEVVVIKDVPMPVVAEGDVLVRVMTTAVNIGDARLRALRVPRGLSIPTRLAMFCIPSLAELWGFSKSSYAKHERNATSSHTTP